jgi:hypothetical protein
MHMVSVFTHVNIQTLYVTRKSTREPHTANLNPHVNTRQTLYVTRNNTHEPHTTNLNITNIVCLIILNLTPELCLGRHLVMQVNEFREIFVTYALGVIGTEDGALFSEGALD